METTIGKTLPEPYPPMSEQEIRTSINALKKIFADYYLPRHPEIDKLFLQINYDALVNVVTKVDKRRYYYLVFHEGTQLSELRETALIAYWILKSKPFFYPPDKCATDIHINEGFATFLVLEAAFELSRRHAHGKAIISKEYASRLIYYADCRFNYLFCKITCNGGEYHV
jgi:hypothetical protein